MNDYIFIDRHTGQTLDEATYSGPGPARAHAGRLAIERRADITFAEVIDYRVRPACMLCLTPRPATARAGDWDLCDDCYNAVTAPDPDEMPVDEGLLRAA